MIYTFDSAMTGAPVLSGSAGALRALVKACLVDGFGAGAVATLTVAAGIATATFAAAHPYRVGSVSQFAGATPAGLNGQKRILSITTNAVTYAAPGIADGAATGTITHKVAAAGWQELFAGALANVLCVKPTVPEATGCVLRVDDTGTINARVRAYESMTDVSTGAGPTPLESQLAGGLYWPKSGTANATARPWYMVADERGFYLALSPQGTDRYTLLYAGDIASLKSGDAYGYLLTGNQADQTALTTVPDGCCGWSHRSARSGAYMVRAHTAIGQSLAMQRLGAHHNGSTSDVYAGTAGYSLGTYPNGPNNGLMTGALELHGLGIRGTLPGLLHPVQDCGTAFATGAIVDGTDDLAGRRLLAVRVAPPSGAVTPGTVFLDITGNWSR
ncbi:hypothetical protein IB236_08600 [Acidovorax sp. ACV02]|uniref:hypothetical protein n=1 Tax=Acidovorax sp. ACV02 TaxID=2769310 RepID=UPI00177AB1F9|nr:hypothetical protein [Acidovorax sp. ACV02]MBD9405391.1 hypothetical protein [Acidovorax sp. ACV02]